MGTRFKQFVVRDIGEERYEVPVDNFVWKDDYLGLEVTLCTHAGLVYVTTADEHDPRDDVEEIERRIDSGDFYEFISEILDEWSGEDLDELMELLETQLADADVDLKYAAVEDDDDGNDDDEEETEEELIVDESDDEL